MKRTALIFLLAIFVPALLLGGLALKTAGKQRMILEQQEAELQQKETDVLASRVRTALNAEHQSFAEGVNRLLAEGDSSDLAETFSSRLEEVWSQAGVGFSVTTGGRILSPAVQVAGKVQALEPAQAFLADNQAFLANQIPAEVYQSNPDVTSKLGAQQSRESKRASAVSAGSFFSKAEVRQSGREAKKSVGGESGEVAAVSDALAQSDDSLSVMDAAPMQQSVPQVQQEADSYGIGKSGAKGKLGAEVGQYTPRKVAPQKVQMAELQAPISRLNVETNLFRQIVVEQSSGIISRFVQDQLEIIFWVRPPATPEIVYGVQLDSADLRPLLAPLVTEGAADPAVCLAILDDHARPFAKSLQDFTADWKTPFVATEIGEVLPHWEVVLYLTDPGRLARSARLVQLTLVGLIAIALGAIGFGSYLIVADTRRQLELVQKKTDFVSNVSHELKTPLTSIRMFSELLHDDRIPDEAKRRKYLRIITLESERLTRLINNVLDFAKIERKQKRYQKRKLDLQPVIRRAWEPVEMHLMDAGFETAWEAAPGPYNVMGDEDALAQVIVNLLSNSEKYSTEEKRVEIHSYILDGWVCVSVMDRGAGVPAGEERKIFEQFYRAHDSLSSGVQGSGLGLTLAVRIAKDHGGTITIDRRKGGGSTFTLRLPEAKES